VGAYLSGFCTSAANDNEQIIFKKKKNVTAGFLFYISTTNQSYGRARQQNGYERRPVLVKGNVGERAGDHMRRGTILIEGNAGDYCGSRMTAGTIAVMGQTGRYAGYAMRRGTLLLWNQPQLPASFNDCGAHTLGFLPMLFASFKSLNSRFADAAVGFNRDRRYAGDMAEMGRGEVLVKM